MTFVVRGAVPVTSLPALRSELGELEPAVAMINVRTLDEVVAQSVARERFTTWVVGPSRHSRSRLPRWDSMAFWRTSSAARMREIGIRMALGAGRHHVMSLVFRETAVLFATGLTIGVLAAAISARAIRTLLYDTAPTDPLTYLAVATLLGAVSMLASYLPARRAMAEDPVVTLRTE